MKLEKLQELLRSFQQSLIKSHSDEKEDKKLINEIVDDKIDDHKKELHKDEATRQFLEHWEPKTKHPKEPTAGMPAGKKSSQKITDTGFKLKLVKALADAGQREAALRLQNWNELDSSAEAFIKSNYGPKGMGAYNPTDNIKRKAKNTGESFSDIGQNKNAKKYTTSGSNMQQAHEASQQKAQRVKEKASVRTLADMSPEEQARIKAQLEAKYNKKQ